MTLRRLVIAMSPLTSAFWLCAFDCLRSHRPFMAFVYAVGGVEVWVVLGLVETWMLGGR
jgi:hypothetical protein